MSTSHLSMPATREFRNGNKAPLAFARMEYDQRLAHLRAAMDARAITWVVFTSMHNVGYYTGFLYCSFGRPYGCVITADDCFTVSANIDGG